MQRRVRPGLTSMSGFLREAHPAPPLPTHTSSFTLRPPSSHISSPMLRPCQGEGGLHALCADQGCGLTFSPGRASTAPGRRRLSGGGVAYSGRMKNGSTGTILRLAVLLVVWAGCGRMTTAQQAAADGVPEAAPAPPPTVEGASAETSDAGATLEERFPPPSGYVRADSDGFGAWLRRLPLKPGRPQVLLYDGRAKRNQTVHEAVVDLDVGRRDLQQCADAVMRLRAEYLFSNGCADAVAFDFTNGDPARWSDYRQGVRPRIRGNDVDWQKTASPDDSYDNFRRYLDVVFTYAGTLSLERELDAVADPARVEIGDVFIQGGSPGHAVVVADMVENDAGQRRFLLVQSYMPAQEMHVLRSPNRHSPWYEARSSGALNTPEWRFRYEDLKRFPRLSECP